ncbi:hypothetical protein KTT_10540 [Tengunoibacter tsumagoiensis]|uniref:Uncharacterized protein n=1 Tax=Tengunoibacter tsumagoiensis TaxID=2014871 RepID=A0A401ZWC1_9CHLR|nr:hypothetical protein KTT_10540 [Tengunoibacter tsumagoiensis]
MNRRETIYGDARVYMQDELVWIEMGPDYSLWKKAILFCSLLKLVVNIEVAYH